MINKEIFTNFLRQLMNCNMIKMIRNHLTLVYVQKQDYRVKGQNFVEHTSELNMIGIEKLIVIEIFVMYVVV